MDATSPSFVSEPEAFQIKIAESWEAVNGHNKFLTHFASARQKYSEQNHTVVKTKKPT